MAQQSGKEQKIFKSVGNTGLSQEHRPSMNPAGSSEIKQHSHSPAENVISYQKQVKGNNKVFPGGTNQQQHYYNNSKMPNMPNSVSPIKQTSTQARTHAFKQGNREIRDGDPKMSQAQPYDQNVQPGSGQHRRSNTDGNIALQNALSNNLYQGEYNHQQRQIIQQQKQPIHKQSAGYQGVLNSKLQSQFDKQQVQSRQSNANNRFHLSQKNSNQSANSAQLQSNQQNFKFQGKVSVQQAANNLKMVNNQEEGPMLITPTRNSHLQNQAKKDMLGVQKDENSDPFEKGMASQKNDPQGQHHQQLGQNISIEQLQELMKNPQIAQFLKEQIQLQQKGKNQQMQSPQNKVHQGLMPQGLLDADDPRLENMYTDDPAGLALADKSHNDSKMSHQQLPSSTLKCNESNMNSDTSQEILKYQKEWAKQFNEHVLGPNQGKDKIQKSGQGNIADSSLFTNAGNESQINKKLVEAMAENRSSQLDIEDSSQQLLSKVDDSQEKMVILPKSEFINHMQNLNALCSSGSKNADKKLEADINFYEPAQPDTEQSVSPGADVIMYRRDQTHQTHTDEDLNVQTEQDIVCYAQDAAIGVHDDGRSRNIMNQGKQLSLMTACSDVLDCSADLILDNLKEDSQASQKEEEDEYLTFQLCEGEEMNHEMANFISIHMLNDGYIDGEEQMEKAEQEGGLTYQCPQTGSHFEFMDLVGRMRNLKQKRRQIDEAIRQEDEKQKLVKKQKAQQQVAKQKQLQQQKKLNTQVQNIIKSAQQDENDENLNDLNDSMHQSGNIMLTEDDVLILEIKDEEPLQTHHITTNEKVSNNINNHYPPHPNSNSNDGAGSSRANHQISQQYGQKNKVIVSSSKQQLGQNGHIFNTHDGRQKQQKLDDNAVQQQSQLKTHALNPNQQFFNSSNNQKIQIVGTNSMIQPSQTSGSHISNQIQISNSNLMQKQNLETGPSIHHGGGSIINYSTQKNNNNVVMIQNQPNQPNQMHQASSLGSNHASKIQNISKQAKKQNTAQNVNNQHIHDQNQQLIMNLRQNPQFQDHRQAVADNKHKINQKGRKQGNEVGHFRTICGNLGFVGAQSDGQYSVEHGFQNQPGTMIHSNQLSSLVGSHANNTNQVNTALASHRGDRVTAGQQQQAQGTGPNDAPGTGKVASKPKSQGFQKQAQQSKTKSKMPGVLESREQKTAGQMQVKNNRKSEQFQPDNQFNNQMIHTTDKLNQQQTNSGFVLSGGGNNNTVHSQFKQTAQFGPQMNLMKSQLPHQSPMLHGVSNKTKNQSNQMVSHKQIQQKIKSLEVRQNHYMTQVSVDGREAAGQNQIISTFNQYAGAGDPTNDFVSSSKNARNQQKIAEGGIGPLHGQQQPIPSANARGMAKKQNKTSNGSWTGKGYKTNNLKMGALGNMTANAQSNVGNNPANNISNNQNTRKNKLINTGGNMIGYNLAKKASGSGATNNDGQFAVIQQCQPKNSSNQIVRSVGASSNHQYISSGKSGNQVKNANSMGRTSNINPPAQDQLHQKEFKNQQQINNMPQSESIPNTNKKYNQMISFNQYFTQNSQIPPNHQNQPIKDQAMALSGQQVALQQNKLSGLQGQYPHNQIQSYSFDYRQNQNNQNKAIQQANYASIGSINNHAAREARDGQGGAMASTGGGALVGPEVVAGNMPGMNNLRVQGVVSEGPHHGPSKNINKSVNQMGSMGKNMRSFDGNQAQKSHLQMYYENIQQQVPKNPIKNETYIKDMGPNNYNFGNNQGLIKGGGNGTYKQKSSSQQPKESNNNNDNQYDINQDNLDRQNDSNLVAQPKQIQHKKVKSTQFLSKNQVQAKTDNKNNPSNERQLMQMYEKNLANLRLSYNSQGQAIKSGGKGTGQQQKLTEHMGPQIMSTAMHMPSNNLNQSNAAGDPSHKFVQNYVVPSDNNENLINQPGNNNIISTAKVMVNSKAKRVTAATRGIQSGTNARVNTFDNRGLQAKPNNLQQNQNLISNQMQEAKSQQPRDVAFKMDGPNTILFMNQNSSRAKFDQAQNQFITDTTQQALHNSTPNSAFSASNINQLQKHATGHNGQQPQQQNQPRKRPQAQPITSAGGLKRYEQAQREYYMQTQNQQIHNQQPSQQQMNMNQAQDNRQQASKINNSPNKNIYLQQVTFINMK